MWFSAFILLCVILWDFFFFLMIVLLNTWIYYSIFSKIDLIWWDNFSYNFKYIFINEIGFIKKIVLVVGKLTKSRVLRGEMGFCGTPRGGDGVRKFSPSCKVAGDGTRQNYARRGRRPNPSALPRPIAVSTPKERE